MLPITYTNWNRGEPNNHRKNEHCAAVWGGYKWNDAVCHESFGFICQKIPPDSAEVKAKKLTIILTSTLLPFFLVLVPFGIFMVWCCYFRVRKN
jgi:hypothetical protein